MFRIIDKTLFKQKFFSFIRHVPNIDVAITAFWDINERKLKTWYLSQKHETDIIVSASPEFLLLPVANRLGVMLIASKVDKHTGKFDGLNCHDEEKVKRFAEASKVSAVKAFYSDSITDKPLADLIPCSFMVCGENSTPWKAHKQSVLSRAKHTFLSPEFFVFTFCGGCGTIINLCFSLLFSQRINATLAYVGGYAVSLFVTYLLNSALIFKQKLNIPVFTKIAIPNFLILFTFVAILLNIFYVWEVVVYVSAALFGLLIKFILIKMFAFRGKNAEEKING